MLLPIRIIGVSHKTANILSRESFDSQISKFIEDLKLKHVSGVEFVHISTCNRSEVVFVELGEVRPFTAQELESNFKNVQGIYFKEGGQAVRHFFRVCAGLDSMVLGESEILGQVKNAYRASTEAGTVGPVLHKLFQESFRVAKKLRSNTSIGTGSLSVASLAIHQASRIFGSLKDRKALVIGAGSTGTLVARILKQEKIDKLFITNRTYEKAVLLGEELDAIPLPFNKYGSILGLVDIVVVAVNLKDHLPLISRKSIAEVYSRADYSPLCILDLSVPRMVDREIESLDAVYSFCIDDLTPIVNENLKHRQMEALRAEEIIEADIGVVLDWYANRSEASLIAQVGEMMLSDSTLFQDLNLSESQFRIIIKRSLNNFFIRLRKARVEVVANELKQSLIENEILENLRLNTNR